MSMDCIKAQRYAADLADHRLDQATAHELQNHLSNCSDCRVSQQRALHLQQLLSVKRHESPGAHYFDGFVNEFHRRLEVAPTPSLWSEVLRFFHTQNAPVLRYGFAHACGVVFACGMILRAVMTGDVTGNSSALEIPPYGVPNLQSTLPAPQSTPRRIASVLPRQPDPTLMAGSALIIPGLARDELIASRYILDRISLSPASYEVASFHF